MRPTELFGLFSPVSSLKGVGPKAASGLQRLLGMDYTPFIRDLLFHLPNGVVDRRVIPPIDQAVDGQVATFMLTVQAHHPAPPSRRRTNRPHVVECVNETGMLQLVFFHAREESLKQWLPVGAVRVVSGKVERDGGLTRMIHPDIITTRDEWAAVQALEPQYPLCAEMTNRKLAKLMQQALPRMDALPDDARVIAPEVVAHHQWPSFVHAIKQLHQPKIPEDIAPESDLRRRAAFEEMLAHQLRLVQARTRTRTPSPYALKSAAGGQLARRLMEMLPFEITPGQEAAMGEIRADLASGLRMTRLLQGDVGSGKTLVALLTMLEMAEQGFQTALMAPTELIARQHAMRIEQWLRELPARVVLLTGSIKGRARSEALQAIADGSATIIIGTHALFQESVEFANLALIVVDEQHRFGVEQRLALTAKGKSPHLLHMSATPIPRTLMLAFYGDMDHTILHGKPQGRTPVETRLISLERYQELFDRLKAAIAQGQKCYWICPAIDAQTEDSAAVQSRAIEFRAALGQRVGMVHGRIAAPQRAQILEDFAGTKYDLLVATTVVEVGVDVPSATIMIIEQAERFGLSQLHQLRGRVGRSAQASYCILLYSPNIGEDAIARLTVLRHCDDGFELAEKDMQLRGGGEVLGLRQSGRPEFVFADLHLHADLITPARESAMKAVQSEDVKVKEATARVQALFER